MNENLWVHAAGDNRHWSIMHLKVYKFSNLVQMFQLGRQLTSTSVLSIKVAAKGGLVLIPSDKCKNSHHQDLSFLISNISFTN